MLWLGIALSFAMGASVGFFGGGGSILTVPLLAYVFGLPAAEAIASSLAIVGVVSLSSAIQYARAGYVELRTSLYFGVAGMFGAYGGGRIGAVIDGRLLLILFASMMAATALMMWRGPRGSQGSAASEAHFAPLRLIAQGLGVGAIAGLIGAGGGFLIVPALTLWAGLPVRTAVGSSLAIIVLNSGAGLAGYLSTVSLDYSLVVSVTTVAIAGSLLGTRLARRVDPSLLRRAFAGFVAVMACGILVQELRVFVGSVREVFPRLLPELGLAVAMLVLGVVLGRATRRGPRALDDAEFSEGAGI